MSTQWRVLDDADAVAREACRLIGAAASRAIGERGRFSLVLAGGSTPQAAYRLLAQTDQQWDAWHIWFGDERCLPPGHPERNSRMAHEALLSQVPIPAAQVHPIAAELGPEGGAAQYAGELAGQRPFDLVLLGMGEDGHTASLFPGHTHPPGALTVAVHDAPKPPPHRVSLGTQALADSRTALLLICGGAKRRALTLWRAGEPLPVTRVVAAAPRAVVLTDRAAATDIQ